MRNKCLPILVINEHRVTQMSDRFLLFVVAYRSKSPLFQDLVWVGQMCWSLHYCSDDAKRNVDGIEADVRVLLILRLIYHENYLETGFAALKEQQQQKKKT